MRFPQCLVNKHLPSSRVDCWTCKQGLAVRTYYVFVDSWFTLSEWRHRLFTPLSDMLEVTIVSRRLFEDQSTHPSYGAVHMTFD